MTITAGAALPALLAANLASRTSRNASMGQRPA